MSLPIRVALGALATACLLVPSAHALPSGYAYEMVSPADKNGASVATVDAANGGGLVSVDGDRIGFMSTVAFPGSESAGTSNWYVSRRGEASWTTRVLAPAFRATVSPPDGAGLVAISDDLTKVVVETNVDPVTGAPQPRRNFYFRDTVTDVTRKLTPDPVVGSLDYSVDSGLRYARSYTPSLSHLVIATDAALTTNAPVSGSKLYVVDTATAEVELATVAGGTPGTPIVEPGGSTACGANRLLGHNRRMLSNDGSVVYFCGESDSPDGKLLYRRDLDAGQTVAVNTATGDPTLGSDGYLLAVSSEGRYAFFATTTQLVPEDQGAGEDVYRYDAHAPAGSRLTLISLDGEPADGVDGGVIGVVGANDAGDRLYFMTASQLVAGAPTGAGGKLYLWDDGTLKYVATDPDSSSYEKYTNQLTFNQPIRSSMDPRGGFLAIEADSRLIASQGGPDPCTDQMGCAQVYLYDAEASTPLDPDFTCVSCLPPGQVTPWAAGLELFDRIGPKWPVQARRTRVTADGSVLFATPTPLVPEDLNGPGKSGVPATFFSPPEPSQGQDAYLYRDGKLELISAGRALSSSFAVGLSPDAKTIAFITVDRLTAWDTDDAYDTYVARAGGGLPGPPQSPPGCVGDDCQRSGSGTVTGRSPSSDSTYSRGDGSARPRGTFSVSRIRAAQRARLARTGKIALSVKVPRAGRVLVRGRARMGGRLRTVMRSSKRVRRSGRVRVSLKLRPVARKRLASGATMRLSLAVRFSGARGTKRSVLTLKRRAAARDGRAGTR